MNILRKKTIHSKKTSFWGHPVSALCILCRLSAVLTLVISNNKLEQTSQYPKNLSKVLRTHMQTIIMGVKNKRSGYLGRSRISQYTSKKHKWVSVPPAVSDTDPKAAESPAWGAAAAKTLPSPTKWSKPRLFHALWNWRPILQSNLYSLNLFLSKTERQWSSQRLHSKDKITLFLPPSKAVSPLKLVERVLSLTCNPIHISNWFILKHAAGILFGGSQTPQMLLG